MAPPAPGPWPTVTITDTRGILRREPLTPPLARAVREALAAGRRVLLVVSRLASALACDECGEIVRCPTCALALVYTRSAATLLCRLCATTRAAAGHLPALRGAAGCRRSAGASSASSTPCAGAFPRCAWRGGIPRPRAARAARRSARRRPPPRSSIGTRGALRLFGPSSLGLAGFVSPDQLLRLPDFRAGERMFALMWAAAERVGAQGSLVIQSQNPEPLRHRRRRPPGSRRRSTGPS